MTVSENAFDKLLNVKATFILQYLLSELIFSFYKNCQFTARLFLTSRLWTPDKFKPYIVRTRRKHSINVKKMFIAAILESPSCTIFLNLSKNEDFLLHY